MSYKSSGFTLGYIYTIGLGLKIHTPLLLRIESLPNFLYIDFQLSSKNYLFWPIGAQLLLV